MGSNTEEKSWSNVQNWYKNISKEVKSNNFCYRKLGRVITIWAALDKSHGFCLFVTYVGVYAVDGVSDILPCCYNHWES